MKKPIKIFSYFVFITAYLLVFLVITAFVISQTDWFRNFVRDQLSSVVNEKINGKLEINSIEGNFLSRLDLNGINLIHESDTLISVPSIEIRYMPVFLLFKNLNISVIEIRKPSIHFEIMKDGSLNFGALAKSNVDSAAADTLKSDNSSLIKIIDIKTIKLTDAKIVYNRENYKNNNYVKSTIDYRELKFDDFNAWISFYHSPKKTRLEILNIELHEKKSGFTLNQLALKVELEDSSIEIPKFILKTDSSSVELNAKLRFENKIQFDSTFSEQLKRAGLNSNVSLNPFTFFDLYVFIPKVDMLGGSVVCDVAADGTLDTLNAKSVELDFGKKSHVKASGKLYHLLDGSKLTMNTRVTDATVYYSDVHSLLPNIPIPSFEKAGEINFTASYSGRPKDFESSVNLESKTGGKFTAIASFDFTKTIPEYKVSLEAHELNLQPFLNNSKTLNSNLNLTSNIEGRGFVLDQVEMKSKTNISASYYTDISVDQAEIIINGSNKKVEVKTNASSYFAEINLGAVLEKVNDAFRFDIDLEGRRINIENILPQLSKSKINFTSKTQVEINDQLMISSKVEINQLNLDNVKYNPVKLDVLFHTQKDKKTISEIKSDWLDINVNSTDNVEYWSNYLNAMIKNMKVFHSDSSNAVMPDLSFITDSTETISWKWKIKDITSLAALIKQPTLKVMGSGSGITKVHNRFLSTIFDINLDSVSYNKTLFANNIVLKSNLDSLNIEQLLDYANGYLNISVGEFVTGERNWGKIKFDSKGIKNRATYSLSVDDPGKLLSLNTDGFINITSDSVSMDVTNFFVKSDLSDWEIKRPSMIYVTTTSVGCDTLELRSGNQSLTISGELNNEGTKEALIVGTNLEISPLVTTFNPNSVVSPKGKFDLRIYAFGFLNDPSAELDLNSGMILVGGNKYGQLEVKAVYDGGTVDVKSFLKDEDKNNIISVNGIIPLKKPEDVLNADQLNFHAVVNDFKLDKLKGFIPTVLEIGGSANGKIDYEYIDDANYELNGDLNIQGGKLRLESNNVLYSNISGSATLRKNLVIIKDIELISPNKGKAKLYGSFELENFVPYKNYNINLALTDFEVLNKAQSNENTVYGKIELQGQLKFKGGFDQSTLNGTIKLKNTDIGILSGSANERAFVNEDSFINWVGKTTRNTLIKSDSDSVVQSSQYKPKKKGKLFRTGFNAYVQIDPSQNTKFTLILNRATGERLETYVGGNLLLQYQRENISMTGKLNVLDGNYGFYTAKFKVQKDGEIKWSGNIADPELNLIAQTTLIRNRETSSAASTGDAGTADAKSTQKESNLISIGIEGTASRPLFTYDIVSTLADGQTKSAVSSPLLRENLTANIISLILLNQWANDPWNTQNQRNFSNVGSGDLTNTGVNALFGTLSNHLGRYLNSADSRIKFVNFQVQKNQSGLTDDFAVSGGYELSDSWTISGGVNYNPNSATTQTTTAKSADPVNFSVRVEQKLTENLSWEFYRTYNPYTFDAYEEPIIYGVSLFYRKRFYYWNELNPFRKEEKNAEAKPDNGKPETGAPPVPKE